MERVVLYDNKIATMWFYPDTKIVHHKIHQLCYGEEFQKLLLTGLEAIRNYKAQKWLSDERNNGVTSQKDLEWAVGYFLHPAIYLGWKYWAVVQHEIIITNSPKQNPDGKGNIFKGVITRYFTNPEEAFVWLKDQ